MNEHAKAAREWLGLVVEGAAVASAEATLAVAYEARTANLIARAALAERDMRDRLLDEVDARLKETN